MIDRPTDQRCHPESHTANKAKKKSANLLRLGVVLSDLSDSAGNIIKQPKYNNMVNIIMTGAKKCLISPCYNWAPSSSSRFVEHRQKPKNRNVWTEITKTTAALAER